MSEIFLSIGQKSVVFKGRLCRVVLVLDGDRCGRANPIYPQPTAESAASTRRPSPRSDGIAANNDR